MLYRGIEMLIHAPTPCHLLAQKVVCFKSIAPSQAVALVSLLESVQLALAILRRFVIRSSWNMKVSVITFNKTDLTCSASYKFEIMKSRSFPIE